MSELMPSSSSAVSDGFQDPLSKVGYDLRVEVPDNLKSWDLVVEDYAPVDYTNEVVLNEGKEKGWADPDSPADIDFSMRPSFIGQLKIDRNNGRPLNPMGRQGLAGRGTLGKWGPNNAADPVVVACLEDGSRKILLIRRKDTGEWALPGGMVDPGEHVTLTAKRELQEEAGIDLEKIPSEVVYSGYVDDPRNTDNAWMETEASLLLINHTPEPKAGDDAEGVQWFDLSSIDLLQQTTGGLYASHSSIIEKVLDKLNSTQS